MITRRNLLIVLGAAMVMPRVVFAQAKPLPVLIGWLNAGRRAANSQVLTAFKEEMAALGWKEGSNYVLEERWADGRMDSLVALGGEIAAKAPTLIIAGSVSAAVAATKSAPKIPIVYVGGDPVASGLVKSLARPGGMVTGVSNVGTYISEKYLELLLAAVPTLRRIGFLFDNNIPNHAVFLANARRSAAQFSVEARYAEVARPVEIEPALSRLVNEGVQALVLMPGQALEAGRQRMIKFALAQRWPVISGQTSYGEEGALLSYGADRVAQYRRLPYFVDRILRGATPADLPIEQSMTFELVVNMKTAKAFGLTMPPEIMVRATRVIQ